MVVQSVGSRRDDVQIWAESMCARHIFCCAEQLKIGQRSLNLEVFRSKYDIEICKRFTSTPSTWRLHDFEGGRCCANHLLFCYFSVIYLWLARPQYEHMHTGFCRDDIVACMPCFGFNLLVFG